MSSLANDNYFIPEPSRWPLVTMIGLALFMFGLGMLVNDIGMGPIVMGMGMMTMGYLFFGWFHDVIGESQSGVYNAQVDRSFRHGMVWFIMSEIFFFMCFFGSLLYIRVFAIPWLGGEGQLGVSHLLWENFVAVWPTNGPGNVSGAFEVMKPGGLPAVNTALLLSSGVTITIAHWGLKKDNRKQLIWGLAATVFLGLAFIACQAYEYGHAYAEMNLTLATGIYGATFYMMTGFHGLHVTIGAIMLMSILARSIKGDFSAHNHFGFEAVAWYWHFVDVVWLGLYFFVYWL